jgi:predicted enzyme related to lactoylglutathione lyase
VFIGLRTVIYPTADLAGSKAWYASVLGVDPYFDQPFYVGFDVGGFELGLDPNPEGEGAGPRAYWGVEDVDKAWQELIGHGAKPHSAVTDVGDGIRVATVLDPSGHIFGIIENPHFVQRN